MARGCAQPKREDWPMVALVAMMISCTIDKIARIDIVLIDIT